MSWRRIGVLLALAATLVLITVWAQGYYSKKVFHMEGLKYANMPIREAGASNIGLHLAAASRFMFILMKMRNGLRMWARYMKSGHMERNQASKWIYDNP
ncbi:hypothetical protein M4D81_03335 [Paenibacillus sp. p3-SID867]|uniref:hypothetical protein n=1 Tax=Paenibacillus sp. p3-SID867 TaxID=2916363 RepID=UPI0021A29C45|nr:hypothetical protein [Paenibacillus sp. p3-SID867]MCT1398033.1 hypothetical protein [Paenibacillus sp. p3-SID867]